MGEVDSGKMRVGTRWGIPTTYKGVRFRSRLEAKWAAFFDELKWKWAYEPIDLDFYVPDFVLSFDAGQILVEVKPESDLPPLRAQGHRIVAAGWNREYIVVGSGLIWNAIYDPEPVLGAFGCIDRDYGGAVDRRAEDEAVLCRCLSCGNLAIRANEGSWQCRGCGAYDGNGHLGSLEPGEVSALWNASSNRVQWRAA